jgi:hypothetical protein
MKKTALLLLLLAIVPSLWAQSDTEDDKNVVISKSTRTFKFVKGNSENPVQIKEKSSRLYSCNNYRTDIQVAEFYNGYESIDDVTIYVNDSKKHGITPRYEYYNADGIFIQMPMYVFQLALIKKRKYIRSDF